LIQLRETKRICAVHDQGIGVWDIEPGFNDRSAQEHINLPGGELLHYLSELLFGQPAVPDANPRLRDKGGKVIVDRWNGLDAVVDKKHLSTAIQFAHNGFPHQFFIIWTHMGDDRQTFLGRGVDIGDIPNAAECHVERARNGGGCKGEHIHLGVATF